MVPDIPTLQSPSVSRSSIGKVTVLWNAPSNGGNTITGYTILPKNGTSVETRVPLGNVTSYEFTTARSYTSGQLTQNVSYTFTIIATNAAGDSVASVDTSSITPFMVPDAPVPTASVTLGIVTVSWSPPPLNNGNAIIDYTVTPKNMTIIPNVFETSVTVATNTSRAFISGTSSSVAGTLISGNNYTFTVIARNNAGSSSAGSTTTPVMPSTTPSAVGINGGVSASTDSTPGSATVGKVTVTWNPANPNGSDITEYRITATSTGQTTVTASITASGVPLPVTYTYATTGTA